jgi:isochorismate synthase
MVFEDILSADDMERIKDLPDQKLNNSSITYSGDTDKHEYINLINTSIEKIKAGDFEKVVLSRVKSVEGNFIPFMQDIFEHLCSKYPHAFVYLFKVAGECWTGATPEPFIGSENRILKTVSLAGTRPYREEDRDIAHWNRKELQEQNYVTLHIEKILNDFHIKQYTKTGPYVARAGNLLHLRTDFEFSLESAGINLPSLIHALHPTPAVCGMSTGNALDFIKKSEKHKREYYTGFLGPLGLADQLNLFVNLRCMKVYNNRLVLYIGGGITADSVAEEEWEETEIKAETVMSVLKKLR